MKKAREDSEVQKFLCETLHDFRCGCGASIKATILEALNAGWELRFPDQEMIRDEDVEAVHCGGCRTAN